MKHRIAIIAAALLIAPALAACVPVAVGAGAGVGVAAAQEGGIKTAYTDKEIYVKISNLWIKNSFDLYRRLDLNVKEGRVLIAGSVPNADARVEAVRLAWQVQGVKQVLNEISVDQPGGVTGYMKDSWITGNVKSLLLVNKDIQSINYNVDTVNGTVYMMGIAQDKIELQRALDVARNTRYVKNVVSYVRLRGETPAGALDPTTSNINNNNTSTGTGGGYSGNSYSGGGYNGDTSVTSEPIGPAPYEQR